LLQPNSFCVFATRLTYPMLVVLYLHTALNKMGQVGCFVLCLVFYKFYKDGVHFDKEVNTKLLKIALTMGVTIAGSPVIIWIILSYYGHAVDGRFMRMLCLVAQQCTIIGLLSMKKSWRKKAAAQ